MPDLEGLQALDAEQMPVGKGLGQLADRHGTPIMGPVNACCKGGAAARKIS
jgi:hypothetical protein